MTTPASFNTAARIIQFAMEDAGILQDGDEPTSEQYAKMMQRLNDLINLWQTQGIKLWLLEVVPVTLIADQYRYKFGPTLTNDVVMDKPMRVISAAFNYNTGSQTPLIVRAWTGFFGNTVLPEKGVPTFYFVDKAIPDLEVIIWPVPNAQTVAQGNLQLLLQLQVPDLVSLTDTMAFPKEWFLALRWGLADDICTGQPQAIMDRCERRATAYRTALEDWDVEDAPVRFIPDARGSSNYGSFH